MSTTSFDKFEKVFYDNMEHLQQQIVKPDYTTTDYLRKFAQTYDAIEN